METKILTKENYFFLVFCFVPTALVYWPGIHGPFIYDDLNQISENIKLHGISNLRDIFFCGLRQVRVLQNLSFALNWAMGGGETWVFKVFNLGLHFINGVLLFRFLKLRISRPIGVAYFVTLLFLLHPLQTQAVTYIMGRISLIEAFFKLLLLNMIGSGKKLPICAVLLFSYLGKESNLLLPLLIVIYYLTIEKRSLKQLPKKSLLIYFLTLPMIAPIYYLLREPASAYLGTTSFTLYPQLPYLFHMSYYYFFHLYLIVNPSAQSLIHPYGNPSLGMITAGALVMVLCLGTLLYAVVNRSKKPDISFFILFFFFSLAPTNSFLQMINPFAEYRLYTANIAIFFFIAVCFDWVLQNTKMKLPSYFAAACLVCYWTFFTYKLTSLWQDTVSLLTYSLESYPSSSEISGMLGREALVKNDFATAEKYLKTAIIDNQSEPIRTLKYDAFLVKVYLFQGRFREADTVLDGIKNRIGVQNLPPEYFTLRRLTADGLNRNPK